MNSVRNFRSEIFEILSDGFKLKPSILKFFQKRLNKKSQNAVFTSEFFCKFEIRFQKSFPQEIDAGSIFHVEQILEI